MLENAHPSLSTCNEWLLNVTVDSIDLFQSGSKRTRIPPLAMQMLIALRKEESNIGFFKNYCTYSSHTCEFDIDPAYCVLQEAGYRDDFVALLMICLIRSARGYSAGGIHCAAREVVLLILAGRVVPVTEENASRNIKWVLEFAESIAAPWVGEVRTELALALEGNQGARRLIVDSVSPHWLAYERGDSPTDNYGFTFDYAVSLASDIDSVERVADDLYESGTYGDDVRAYKLWLNLAVAGSAIAWERLEEFIRPGDDDLVLRAFISVLREQHREDLADVLWSNLGYRARTSPWSELVEYENINPWGGRDIEAMLRGLTALVKGRSSIC